MLLYTNYHSKKVNKAQEYLHFATDKGQNYDHFVIVVVVVVAYVNCY